MKSIVAMMFMFLVVLFALCVTAMGNTIVDIDGEAMVMSTGPPTVGVFQTCDSQDRVEAIGLVYFIGDAVAAERDLQTENEYAYNANSERSGRALWYNFASRNGAPLHRWIQA